MLDDLSPQIFLCYASEDRTEVLDFYRRLKERGYRPWLDKIDLLPGQSWHREIPKAIRASDFILIFLSSVSVAKRGYIQKEFKLALDILDEIPEGAIYLIPVRLDNCEVPEQFSSLQWCDLFEEDGFNRIIAAVNTRKVSSSDLSEKIEAVSKKETVIRQRHIEQVLQKYQSWSPTASWIFGSILVLFFIATTFFIRELTDFQRGVFRFLMALTGASFSLFFVGGLLLKWNLRGLTIGATVGFAIFVLIQFIYDPFLVQQSMDDGAATPETEWPMFGHDAGRTHWNRGETNLRPPLTQKMKTSIRDFAPGYLSVADGTLFIAGMEAETDKDLNRIFAVDAFSGKKLWKFTLNASGRGDTGVTPTYANKRVFIGGQKDYKLYALDAASGESQRVWPGIREMWESHPAVESRWLYFVGSDKLYGMDIISETVKWSYPLHESKFLGHSPAVDNGVVYIMSDNGILHAIDAITGQQKWYTDTSQSQSHGILAAAGTIYIGSPKSVNAFDATVGTLKWSHPLTPSGKAFPDLALAEGLLYVVNYSVVYALDIANGEEVWHFPHESYMRRPVVANGIVYLHDYRNLVVLDAKAGKELDRVEVGAIRNGPVVAYGRVYVATIVGPGDYNTELYAFGN